MGNQQQVLAGCCVGRNNFEEFNEGPERINRKQFSKKNKDQDDIEEDIENAPVPSEDLENPVSTQNLDWEDMIERRETAFNRGEPPVEEMRPTF